MADDLCHMIRLIEISPVDQLADPQALRAHLGTLDDPRVQILPQAAETPWVIAHTRDLDAEALLALLPTNQGFAVTQLRCRIDLGAPSAQSLRSFIESARHQHALVLGRAAVERAAQRRRLDLVVIASDFDSGYADSLERILLGCASGVQVIVAAVTARELGPSRARNELGLWASRADTPHCAYRARYIDIKAALSRPCPAHPHRPQRASKASGHASAPEARDVRARERG